VAAQGQFDIVSAILADVGVELGLGVPTADFAGTGSDVNAARLTRLLKSTGRRLVLQHPWLQLRGEYTFTTAGTTTYTLPDAFQSVLDITAWNRTTNQRVIHVTDEQWHAMKATGITTLTMIFRQIFSSNSDSSLADKPQLEFITATGTGDTIALECRSRHWVRPAALAATLLDAPTAATDRVMIDTQLITRALKLAFLRELGFDSTAAQMDFEETLATVRSANAGPAEVLTIGSSRSRDWPHVPETEFGV
jgi:hypothetical protein